MLQTREFLLDPFARFCLFAGLLEADGAPKAEVGSPSIELTFGAFQFNAVFSLL